MGFDAVVGAYASPYTPGSAYVLLHHVFGEANGVKGAWGHALGGMGSITQAMAGACREAGVEITLDAPVRRISIAGGRARGVVLEDGSDLEARVVVANVGPKVLYESLVEPEHLSEPFRERIGAWKCGSGVLRMNVALSKTPQFHLPPAEGAAPSTTKLSIVVTLAQIPGSGLHGRHC